MRLTVRVKAFILTGVIVAIYIGAFAYAISIATDFFEVRQDERVFAELDSVEREIHVFLDLYENQVATLSHIAPLQELVDTPSDYWEDYSFDKEIEELRGDVGAIFLDYMDDNDDFLQIRYIDNNGEEIVVAGRSGRYDSARLLNNDELENKADRYYFTSSVDLSEGAVFVSRLDLNVEDGVIVEPFQSTLRMAIPVFDRDGENRGILVANIFGDTITQVLDRVNKDVGNLSLVDNEGYYLVHPSDPDLQWGRDLETGVIAPNFTDVDSDFYDDLYRQGSFSYSCPNEDGSGCISYFNTIEYSRVDPESFWVVFTRINADSFYASLRPVINLAATTYGIIVLVAIMLSIFGIQYITKPLILLVEAIKRINLGDFSSEVPMVSNDEIGDLAQKMNELIRSERLKEKNRYEFISSASHQLRTPLSSVNLSLENLKGQMIKSRTAKKYVADVENIEVDLGRMAIVIDDMLTYLEIGPNYFASNLKKVDVSRFVAEILSNLQAIADQRQVKLSAQIGEDIAVLVEEERFKGALVQLLMNAIEYSKEGGAVVVSAKKEDRQIIFSVTDSGIGIPRRDQINLFTKFFRARNAYEKKSVGSGLGLVLAKRIIEGHGGRIWFTSKEGDGTTFSFSLFSAK